MWSALVRIHFIAAQTFVRVCMCLGSDVFPQATELLACETNWVWSSLTFDFVNVTIVSHKPRRRFLSVAADNMAGSGRDRLEGKAIGGGEIAVAEIWHAYIGIQAVQFIQQFSVFFLFVRSRLYDHRYCASIFFRLKNSIA